jgi:hypothetical protein
MGQFLHKYNTDDVHSRAVIVGLVNLLNSKVQYKNVLSDTVIDTVTVPFFYSMTGDERFLQDFFLEWNDCVHPKIADGNYDVIPRGIVNLTSTAINTSAMTHRFVRGSYVREVNGQLQSFNAFLNSIPLSMNFDVEIETDTNLDAFKIQQSIIETFYKTQVYSVGYKGFRVPCQVGFPEDYGLDKPIEFTYQSDAKIKIKFTLAVETYFPVTDPTTERLNSNRLSALGLPINIGQTASSEPANPSIPVIENPTANPSVTNNRIEFFFQQPNPGSKYFSGTYLPIRWTNTGTVVNVNLYYRVSGEDWIPIVEHYENNGFYDWYIPFFTGTSGDLVKTTVGPKPGCTTCVCLGRGASLRAIINSNGEVERILILKGGTAYTNEDVILVTPTIIPPDTVSFVQAEIAPRVIGGEIIGYDIISPGSGYPVPTSQSTFIELKIEDDINKDNFKIADVSNTFVGDTDVLGANPDYITNVDPSVGQMISDNVNLLTTVSGPGVQTNSTIINVDAINNRLQINGNATLTISEGEYTLSPSIAIFEIQ